MRFIGSHIQPTQRTGFSNCYFSFGDPTNTSVGVGYNRTLAFSNDTESSRTAFTSGLRITQGAGGFSSTNIYLINGYQSGLNTTKNTVLAASDSTAVLSTTFSVERRGPAYPLPHFQRSRIYFISGYSDSLGYRTDTTYITTATDTATNTTALTSARHVAALMYNNFTCYISGGYTTGDTTTNTIFKYVLTTDTSSTPSITETFNSFQGYGLSNTIFAIRAGGFAGTNTNNIKITYATETKAGIANGPEAFLQTLQGVSSTTSLIGYLWTGYRSFTLNRLLHKYTHTADSWSNSSYTTSDTNTGWIQSTGGV